MKLYTLIDADGVPRPSATPGALGGHRGSRIYGRLDCPGAARAIARGGYVAHRVFFADEATAIAAGYRPCAACLPGAYRAWKVAASQPPALRHAKAPSPIGDLLLVAHGDALREVRFGPTDVPEHSEPCTGGVLGEAIRQLGEYAAGARTTFDLPLRPAFGGPFERRVWAEVRSIPCGSTATYGDLAARLDAPRAARAVGAANGRNPLPVVIPCHRVVGARGALTGYAGGLDRKRALLAHERALA